MATAEWAYYAQLSRIPTARRRKRLVKKYNDKKILKLDRQLSALYETERNLGYEELRPPVQRGWKRSFVLREDLRSGRDAEFFTDLLKKINTIEYSHRRDFKKKKRRRGKKVYVERPQHLRVLYEWELARLKITEREKMYFAEVIVPSHRHRENIKQYVFLEPWRFRLKTEANMITQVRVFDSLLQQEIKELDDRLYLPPTRGRWWKLTRGQKHDYSTWQRRLKLPKDKYKAILRRNPMHELDD